MSALPLLRDHLHQILDRDEDWILRNWVLKVQPRIDAWWRAYKDWERTDTFTEAFRDGRMTVRTFASNFDKQVSKEFEKGTIKVGTGRFFADSQHKSLSPEDQERHHTAFHGEGEWMKYHAKRGIDSSAFANPKNFASREKKYEEGLHDLSASLLNPRFPISGQVHNKGDGVHYSFLPLSFPEDQEILHRLIQMAKKLKATLPAAYELIRGYRARMTRVKLAQDFDLAIGYSAVPVPKPGEGPMYKLRYGLGETTTRQKPDVGGQETITVTPEWLANRQRAARNFREILLTAYANSGPKGKKNEIVLAIRSHNGPFPVYAYLQGTSLICYDIVGGQLTPNGRQISLFGVVT